jgi:hypothetical protein
VYRAAAASPRTNTANTHRHGWRSGIALMASGRILPLEARGSLTVTTVVRSRPHLDAHSAIRVDERPQYDGTQLAPTELLLFTVTAELAIAPSATPQVLSSFV